MAGRSTFCLALLAAIAPLSAGEPATDPAGLAFFEAKVRPILAARCYQCHSAESKKSRGGLLLDTKAGWVKGGDNGPAIVPGNPDESLVVQAVRYDDPALKMPPKGKLDPAEVAVLAEWARRGAPDPRVSIAAAGPARRTIDLAKGREHWAFRPLGDAVPPEAPGDSPIDRFLGRKLAEKGLSPASPADRRTLIRRATFDLIGLPPTPEEVDVFLADGMPDAYEKVVDRLLAGPHYGERWARHWLDLARFAESHGFEHDYDRPTAYHYRDFVVEALNRDLPYDTFVRWQLAGDELAPDDPLALKATGFLAAGVHATQITLKEVEKERYDELDDMANTAGTAFLALTVGCARCHDHKYDPIPQADYYRLLATFTTTVRTEVDLPRDPAGLAEARRGFDAEHPPYLAALAAFEADQLPARLARWEDGRRPDRGTPGWVVLEPTAMTSAGGAAFARRQDGSIVVSGTNAEFDTYTITAPCDLGEVTAVRVEVLADPMLVAGGPGRAANGNFDLTDLKVRVVPRFGIGRDDRLELVNPKATFEQAGLPVRASVDDDPKSGWAIDPRFGRDHAAVFEVGPDARLDGASALRFVLDFRGNAGHNLGRFRLSATSSPRPVGLDGDGIPATVAAILATPRGDRTAGQTSDVLAWYRTIDPEWRARKAAIDTHAKLAPAPAGPKALICSEGLPAVRLHTQGGDFLDKTHFLRRGDVNQKGDEAIPGFLQVLTSSPDAEGRWRSTPPAGWRTSHRRASLANWMTDVDAGAGALLARVIVNRLWAHHLGRGIVATPSDFGMQAAPPSHPELLDWLARDLIRNGWRLKPLHKAILLSAAYRRGCEPDRSAARVDPDNALFGHQTRRRLEAEAIRDALLAVSGRLDTRMYGPGTLDERQTRRSLYFTVKRSKLIPMMTLFDAPDALQPIASRQSTTVAPQSLLLMNSPTARDWAASFAYRAQGRCDGSPASFVREVYLIALGRPPADDETVAGLAFLSGRPGSGRAEFCQVVMSLNEFVYIE